MINDNIDRIVVDLDWVVSGWTDLLRHQANSLHSLIATATAREFDGSLDALSDRRLRMVRGRHRRTRQPEVTSHGRRDTRSRCLCGPSADPEIRRRSVIG